MNTYGSGNPLQNVQTQSPNNINFDQYKSTQDATNASDAASIAALTAAVAALSANTTEVFPMIAPQANLSSVGITTVDAAGNTYAETTTAQRITITSLRGSRQIAAVVGWHVSAGTGTLEVYNNTDASSLATITTTSTTEVTGTTTVSAVATNNGDVITLRVKNSSAGESITIDAGGLVEGDSVVANTTTGTKITGISATGGAYINAVQVVSVAGLSTGTYTAQLVTLVNSTESSVSNSVGTSFTNASNGQVLSRTPLTRGTLITPKISAISSAFNLVMAFGFSQKAINNS